MMVQELTPGDKIHLAAGRWGVFVQRAIHPIWPHLALVIWRLHDGSWSHDALHPYQDVGEPLLASAKERAERLKWAFFGADRGES